jgi:hypothetical protein
MSCQHARVEAPHGVAQQAAQVGLAPACVAASWRGVHSQMVSKLTKKFIYFGSLLPLKYCSSIQPVDKNNWMK